jgi:hypothetical protein
LKFYLIRLFSKFKNDNNSIKSQPANIFRFSTASLDSCHASIGPTVSSSGKNEIVGAGTGRDEARQQSDRIFGQDSNRENPAALNEPEKSTGFCPDASSLRIQVDDLIAYSLAYAAAL